MSWFYPKPVDRPIRLPRQFPKRGVPSFIGEADQVLNLLQHHGARDVVRDYSGYRNHGLLVGGARWVDGPWGWAIEYPGLAGNKIEVPDDPSLRGMATLTVEMWLYLNQFGVIQNLLSAGEPTINYQLYIEISNRVTLGVRTVGWVTSTTVTALVAGWYFIQGVYDGANIQVYLNNVADGAPGIQAGNATNNVGPTRIGSRNGVNLMGISAFPRIYAAALSASQRTQHYETMRSLFGV